jgi:hypothetical protein
VAIGEMGEMGEIGEIGETGEICAPFGGAPGGGVPQDRRVYGLAVSSNELLKFQGSTRHRLSSALCDGAPIWLKILPVLNKAMPIRGLGVGSISASSQATTPFPSPAKFPMKS